MNSGGRYVSPITGPRTTRLGRMHRSDSIPEHSETTPGDNGAATTADADASIGELLMRHSSPLLNPATGRAVTSPLAQRNSSPSPLRLNRPRSNPRSRTPMRIPEEHHPDEELTTSTSSTSVSNNYDTTEGRRITIRLGAGSGVGTNTVSYASRQTRQQRQQPTRVRSSKQGPSHRKARRWNNDNFVNLAAELSATSKGSAAAVEALLKGSAEASSKQHRSVFDHRQHESRAMKKFREDDSLVAVREQFFEGALPCDIHSSSSSSSSSKRKAVKDNHHLTPLERFYRIEARLRRIVVKACENSYAASKVVTTLEEFFVRVYDNNDDDDDNGEADEERSGNEWNGILLEAPTVRTRDHPDRDGLTIRFFFDADSPTGGFHRLLLHAVCQFHCLRAVSSTARVHGKDARVLTATGAFVGAGVGLVDFITERQTNSSGAPDKAYSGASSTDNSISKNMSALKV